MEIEHTVREEWHTDREIERTFWDIGYTVT